MLTEERQVKKIMSQWDQTHSYTTFKGNFVHAHPMIFVFINVTTETLLMCSCFLSKTAVQKCRHEAG